MSGDISLIDSLFPVVEVILGHRMNESDGRLLIESTKKSKPKLFEAGPVIRDGRYAISIDAIT